MSVLLHFSSGVEAAEKTRVKGMNCVKAERLKTPNAFCAADESRLRRIEKGLFRHDWGPGSDTKLGGANHSRAPQRLTRDSQ